MEYKHKYELNRLDIVRRYGTGHECQKPQMHILKISDEFFCFDLYFVFNNSKLRIRGIITF